MTTGQEQEFHSNLSVEKGCQNVHDWHNDIPMFEWFRLEICLFILKVNLHWEDCNRTCLISTLFSYLYKCFNMIPCYAS